MRRVVVTGMAGITALGDSWEKVEQRLRSGRNAVRRMPEWDCFETLNTRLGAPIDDFRVPEHYPRKMVRSMGRVLRRMHTAAKRPCLTEPTTMSAFPPARP